MKSTTLETGMSDFHKLTTIIIRKTIRQGNVKKIFYRYYKVFYHNTFETRLLLITRSFSLYFWKPYSSS